MKIFDFNIHVPYKTSDDVNEVISQDLTLDKAEVLKGLAHHRKYFERIEQANLLLFNTRFFNEGASIKQGIKTFFKKVYVTNLVDFRRSDIYDYLVKAKADGLDAIVFNSYLQQIADGDFAAVIKACKIAEELKLLLCIDGSYGTSKMHTYNNSKLACYIADHITKTQIVILHSGGYNVINAMLLALDKKNVWLDTSFSLPYYMDSSLEIDFAFAYKKMGYKRIVFGSDHPYVKFEEAIDDHMRFFEKFRFPQSAIEDILYNNAQLLFNGK